MRQVTTFILITLLSSVSFAGTANSNYKDLWKTQATSNRSQEIKNDLTMVYGGEDISHRVTLENRTIV